MVKYILAATFMFSAVTSNVSACGEEKAQATQTEGVKIEAVANNATSSACPHAAAQAAGCNPKACTKAGKTTAVAVSNEAAAGKSCNMGSLAAALAIGLGLVGVTLFATRKL